MSLYGHTSISIESLKRWVDSLTVDGLESVDVAGYQLKLDGPVREILESQLKAFSKLVNRLQEGDDWRNCQGILSHLFYNAFIRVDKSSVKIGDFYECLIEPSNLKTYKKMFKGFDYIEPGTINVKDVNGKLVALIGKKSDLIWEVFYNYFINENDDGTIDRVYIEHERYLSIQLFDVEDFSLDELRARVNEILLQVSMKYDMDFKIFEVDAIVKEEGECPYHCMEYTPTGFETIPMFYLTNAINANDERLAYLSYYQVIEYFFVRAQNYFFLDAVKNVDLEHVEHNELRKVLASYKKVSSEREALRLVLTRVIDMSRFKTWISESPEHIDTYCNSDEFKIDISKEDKKIISALVDRIYGYRCSIAHAKGDVEEYIAVPLYSKEKIGVELPLIRYLAMEVISSCSE